MMDYLPPKIWLPPKPAIIRPVEEKPLRPASFLPGMFPGGAVGVSAVATLKGSIIFNGSNEDLSIVFSSSSPNQKTFTISIWFKADADDQSDILIDFFRTGGAEASCQTNAALSGILVFYSDEGASAVNQETTAGSINLAAWHHVVFRIDTTQATAANRIRIYLDGSPNDGQNIIGPGAQNSDITAMFFNGGNVTIGTNSVGGGRFDGRMADIVVVEGQSLAPSEFGYDNGGTWSWKDYTGSVGTHGFRINPQNSGEIGTDQSGNGYNFTLNNMDTSNFDAADLPPV